VSCAFSKELLALHVEGDLEPAEAAGTARHLQACAECRGFVDELQASQRMLGALRHETVDRRACAGMRGAVMAAVENASHHVSWWLRLERALLGHPAYALGVCAIVSLVSVSVYAQMRAVSPVSVSAAAVFEPGNVLERPQGYSAWVVAGATNGQHKHGRVFIDPVAYREYTATGRFPQGTVMVWESAARASGSEAAAGAERSDSSLLVSVKDGARFDGGWGFYDFGRGDGSVSATTAPADAGDCGTCHRRDADDDHVFTQAYPELRVRRSTHT